MVWKISGNIALVAITDILFGNLLAGAVHQVILYNLLNLFHCHNFLVQLRNGLGNLGSEHDVFAGLGHIHRLQNGGNNLLVVEIYAATVTF